MSIFNSIKNVEVSCYLEILYYMTSHRGKSTKKEIEDIVQKYSLGGYGNSEKILCFLMDIGLILYDVPTDVYCLVNNTERLLPIVTDWELDYLKYILDKPQAKLFLTKDLIEKLKLGNALIRQPLLYEEYIIDMKSKYADEIPQDSDSFIKIAEAIEKGYRISYCYTTKKSKEKKFSEAIPYRIEHSEMDGRWWVLLYHEAERRSIKALLEHLSQVELMEKAPLLNDEVKNFLFEKRGNQQMVLRIMNEKNALFRFFSLFEQQERKPPEELSDGSYRVEISYYEFDKHEILKKLLYLGGKVVLEEPKELLQEYLGELKMIMQRYGG